MSAENLTSFGQESFFNEKATFYKGIIVHGESEGVGLSDVEKDSINIAKNVQALNFTGNAVSSVILESKNKTTVRVEMTTNVDGGRPDTVYGGVEKLNGGEI